MCVCLSVYICIYVCVCMHIHFSYWMHLIWSHMRKICIFFICIVLFFSGCEHDLDIWRPAFIAFTFTFMKIGKLVNLHDLLQWCWHCFTCMMLVWFVLYIHPPLQLFFFVRSFQFSNVKAYTVWSIEWTIRNIRAFAFKNDSIKRAW